MKKEKEKREHPALEYCGCLCLMLLSMVGMTVLIQYIFGGI